MIFIYNFVIDYICFGFLNKAKNVRSFIGVFLTQKFMAFGLHEKNQNHLENIEFEFSLSGGVNTHLL